MKIFSFVEQAAQRQRIDNAAPVAPPPNPFAVQFQGMRELRQQPNPLRLLEQDAFTRAETPETAVSPVVPSFNEAYLWLTTHSVTDLKARLKTLMKQGGLEDLKQMVGLLNAAQKGQKLAYNEEKGGRFGFARHYGQAVEALRKGDAPAAKVYLQRAKRAVAGFVNLPGCPAEG